MPTIHYYGKKTNFVGKTLFEILANLRNFGINRMLIKQEELLNYPEKPSYYVVKRVEPVMDEKLEQGAIYAERIFKGSKVSGLVIVDDETWHTDWQLVPKHQESKYFVENPPEYQPVKCLDKSFAVPPLMHAFLKRHYQIKGVQIPNETFAIPLNYRPTEIDYKVDYSRPIKDALLGRFSRKNKQS